MQVGRSRDGEPPHPAGELDKLETIRMELKRQRHSSTSSTASPSQSASSTWPPSAPMSSWFEPPRSSSRRRTGALGGCAAGPLGSLVAGVTQYGEGLAQFLLQLAELRRGGVPLLDHLVERVGILRSRVRRSLSSDPRPANVAADASTAVTRSSTTSFSIPALTGLSLRRLPPPSLLGRRGRVAGRQQASSSADPHASRQQP